MAAFMIALLYWAAPNARQGGFRWITPGSVLAVVVWVVVSAGFAFYVSRFASYNKTYGALGGVIIFLVWLWLTNVAILLGAEFDAELGRARAIAAGLPRHAEPYVPLRDVPKPNPKPDPDDVDFDDASAEASSSPGADSTAKDSTAKDSTAKDSTAKDSTAKDSTAKDSTAKDSARRDSTKESVSGS
jgi:hypothetical protein